MIAWVLLLIGCIPVQVADCRDNGYDAGYDACSDGEDRSYVREHIDTKGCLAAWDEGYAEGVAACEGDTD